MAEPLYAFRRDVASRVKKNNGVKRSGGHGGKVKHIRKGGGGSSRKFCKLIEDASGEYGPVWARVTNRTGTVDGERFRLYYFDSIISGAKPGYKCTWEILDGERVIETGACPTYCFSGGSFTTDSLSDGVVGTPYSASFLPTGTTPGAVQASDLPPGLTIDGSGSITGTPTEAGTFYPTITTTADKTGPAPVSENEKCTITKVVPITITEE